MLFVDDLPMGNHVVLNESGLVVAVISLIGGLVEVADLRGAADGKIVANASHLNFGMVSFLSVSMLSIISMTTCMAWVFTLSENRDAIHVATEHLVIVGGV